MTSLIMCAYVQYVSWYIDEGSKCDVGRVGLPRHACVVVLHDMLKDPLIQIVQ